MQGRQVADRHEDAARVCVTPSKGLGGTLALPRVPWRVRWVLSQTGVLDFVVLYAVVKIPFSFTLLAFIETSSDSSRDGSSSSAIGAINRAVFVC